MSAYLNFRYWLAARLESNGVRLGLSVTVFVNSPVFTPVSVNVVEMFIWAVSVDAGAAVPLVAIMKIVILSFTPTSRLASASVPVIVTESPNLPEPALILIVESCPTIESDSDTPLTAAFCAAPLPFLARVMFVADMPSFNSKLIFPPIMSWTLSIS